MSKHTPTPWHCEENFGNEFVCSKEGPIANCGELVADAEHIVRCVNSHEALAQALDSLLSEACLANCVSVRVYNQAVAALAAAGAPQ